MRNNRLLWFSFIVVILLFWLTSSSTAVIANTASVDTTVKISICGNNIKEGGEQCDGTDLNNQTCQKQGYEAGTGTLSCSFACDFDYSGCGEAIRETEPDSGSGGGSGGRLRAEGSSGGSSDESTSRPDDDRQINKISKQEVERVDEKYTAVRVRGFTSPNSRVFLLQAGVRVDSSVSSDRGKFSLQVDELSAGIHNFSVYAIDLQGKQTNPRTFSLEVEPEVITTLSEIILPPTVSISEAPEDNELVLRGYAVPTSSVALLHNDSQITSNVTTNGSGMYLYNIAVPDLSAGEHEFKARAFYQGKNSLMSTPVFATLGTDQLQLENRLWLPADINEDGSVDLIDFSIITYWFGKESPPDAVDLNKDGQITMRDLSIIAYYWTG